MAARMDQLRCIAHGWTFIFSVWGDCADLVAFGSLELKEGLTNEVGRDRPFYTRSKIISPAASKSRTRHKEWLKHKEAETDGPETKWRGNFGLLTGPELGLSSQINKEQRYRSRVTITTNNAIFYGR